MEEEKKNFPVSTRRLNNYNNLLVQVQVRQIRGSRQMVIQKLFQKRVLSRRSMQNMQTMAQKYRRSASGNLTETENKTPQATKMIHNKRIPTTPCRLWNRSRTYLLIQVEGTMIKMGHNKIPNAGKQKYQEVVSNHKCSLMIRTNQVIQMQTQMTTKVPTS